MDGDDTQLAASSNANDETMAAEQSETTAVPTELTDAAETADAWSQWDDDSWTEVAPGSDADVPRRRNWVLAIGAVVMAAVAFYVAWAVYWHERPSDTAVPTSSKVSAPAPPTHPVLNGNYTLHYRDDEATFIDSGRSQWGKPHQPTSQITFAGSCDENGCHESASSPERPPHDMAWENGAWTLSVGRAASCGNNDALPSELRLILQPQPDGTWRGYEVSTVREKSACAAAGASRTIPFTVAKD